MIEFTLPDVGEGLTEAEIVVWHVAVGDTLEVNAPLLDIETAKSVVEIPSPAAGVVGALHVAAGATVDVGAVIISIDDGATTPDPPGIEAASRIPPATESASEDREGAHEDEPTEPPVVLVGTGPRTAPARRRHLGGRTGQTRAPLDGASSEVATAGTATTGVRAKPPVRALAKRLGVDLRSVPEGHDGHVRREDVEAAARAQRSAVDEPTDGRETRVPIRGVRKATAAAMAASAFTAPHATVWLSVDVTRTVELIARLRQDRRWSGIRVTPLAIAARALTLAIRRHPEINARWDEARQEIVVFHYVNLGIAAATPRGLLVPNIKGADGLDLSGIATSLGTLVETARDGALTPVDLRDGTVTITNIGSLGVDAGTPILVPGEAAILALGAFRELPWVVDGQVVPRTVAQLALSFDHRLVDGALGSAVLTTVGDILHDPGNALLHA